MTQHGWNNSVNLHGSPSALAAVRRNTSRVFDLISREELKRLCQDQGLTDAEIGGIFQVSTNQVYQRRQQMNLIQGQRTSDRLAYIVRLSEAVKYLPDEAISEIEGVVSRYTNGPTH